MPEIPQKKIVGLCSISHNSKLNILKFGLLVGQKKTFEDITLHFIPK